ncbi:hypothetical protein Tco_0617039 [Tanacetum coccineum]
MKSNAVRTFCISIQRRFHSSSMSGEQEEVQDMKKEALVTEIGLFPGVLSTVLNLFQTSGSHLLVVLEHTESFYYQCSARERTELLFKRNSQQIDIFNKGGSVIVLESKTVMEDTWKVNVKKHRVKILRIE